MEMGKHLDFNYLGAAIAAASNTDDDSSIIDTANCEGVIFLCTITDSAATGVGSLIVEQNTANSASGMAALSGGSAVATCAVNDDLNGKLLVVSVHKPRERYLRVNRTSATANIAFGELLYVKYGTRVLPVSDSSTIADKEEVVSPAEA